MGADVLFVGLGSTAGLRAADDELCASLERAGASVRRAVAARPREVRTFALTDLVWARAARRAAVDALRESRPRAVVYSTTTAALLWPEPGAVRFDATAQANRPGRHGVWQRPLERRRLGDAPVLVPWSSGAVAEAGVAGGDGGRVVVVPMPVEPSGPAAGERDLAAVTYAANPSKKGLDRVVAAWAAARRDGEELVVGGVASGPAAAGVRYAGLLPPAEWRALVRRARVYVTAPRREDYGLAQLEALADGCRVVTTPSPGPYAALPVLRALDAGLVAGEAELAGALRRALDAPSGDWPARALEAVAPFRRAAADRVVAERLLPALLG